jgi:hypothetical protein
LLFYLFLKLVRMNLMFSNNEHIHIYTQQSQVIFLKYFLMEECLTFFGWYCWS